MSIEKIAKKVKLSSDSRKIVVHNLTEMVSIVVHNLEKVPKESVEIVVHNLNELVSIVVHNFEDPLTARDVSQVYLDTIKKVKIVKGAKGINPVPSP
jgi:hypothetical protein